MRFLIYSINIKLGGMKTILQIATRGGLYEARARTRRPGTCASQEREEAALKAARSSITERIAA
jgi:hypothetical protein